MGSIFEVFGFALSVDLGKCKVKKMQKNTVFWTRFLGIMFVNGSLKWTHGGGLRWPTLKPKLACWAMPEAKQCRKTLCFEHFSNFSCVS